MGLLGLLKQAKVKVLTFGKHPCNELDEEMKIHYLNGLALIANEDSEREKADRYLASINHSFGFTPDMTEVFKDFATNPDEQAILDMIQAFEIKDIKYNFIIDAMMIAGIDENFCDNKKAVVEQYCEMLKITKKEAEDLEYIYEMFYVQDARALSRYFSRNKTIKQSLFTYLLEYYKIDLAYALKEEEEELLNFKWFYPYFEDGGLKGASEIMKTPISNAQFFIYLNAQYDENLIEVENNKVYFKNEKKTIFMDLLQSDIGFKNGGFTIEDNTKDSTKITGISGNSVISFVKWINTIQNLEYKVVSFYRREGNRHDYFSMDDLITVFNGNEFFYYIGEINVAEDIKVMGDIKKWNGDRYIGTQTLDDSGTSDKFSFRMMK